MSDLSAPTPLSMARSVRRCAGNVFPDFIREETVIDSNEQKDALRGEMAQPQARYRLKINVVALRTIDNCGGVARG